MGQFEDEALRRAILAYDLEEAERLLRAGADPNVLVGSKRARSPFLNPSFDPTTFRALHLAANDDDAELAALLLLHGASPHSTVHLGVLPISIAAQANHLATVELLLHEYRRPKGNFGYCPLRLAAYHEHLKMVELLLEKKPEEMDLDAALHSAVSRRGNLAVTERLVAAGARASWPRADRDPARIVTTRMAALRPQPEALPLFVGHDQVRLIDAAIDGDLPAVERFLREGASPDDADAYGHTTALSAASRRGRAEVVRRLLDAGATLAGPRGKSDPLFDALYGAHIATAELLWSAGCRSKDMVSRAVRLMLPLASVRWAFERDEERDASKMLYAAAQVARLDAARFALERGADPSHRHHTRSTLMIAADRRATDIVELLVAHGADLAAIDSQGRTAMHYALFRGDIDDPDEGPFTYTERALEHPVVQLLLRHGLAIPPRSGAR